MKDLTTLFLLMTALAAPLVPSGCNSRSAVPQSGLPVVAIQVGQKTYQCEIAADDANREQGLMHRKSMPEDHGMIFVFGYEQVLYFWMKNTLIPLDIVYLNRDGKVVAVRQMKPLDVSSVGSKEPAQYAIELNAGQAEKSGVKEGDIIRLPQLPDPR
jgi:uncharacterized membrane protein (UPF0127 family)